MVVTPQKPFYSAKMQEEHHFDFPILFDESLKLADELRLSFEFPEDLAEVYRQLGADLPRIHGTDTWRLPMPARYVVDSSGLIRDAAIHADYTKRPDPKDTAELLAWIS